jgi:phage terminase large subunit-like protein
MKIEQSIAQTVSSMPLEWRQNKFKLMSPGACEALRWDWKYWRRPSQAEPAGDWDVWLVMAGRGFGKTRTGAEWVKQRIEEGARRVALVGRASADVRDVMVEGESGILSCYPRDQRPNYEPSKRRITWPNGAIATCYSVKEPDQLRGPQHDTAWADELASWQYWDAWDQLQLGLRLGDRPRTCVTTTPRPLRVLRELRADSSTHVTTGSTYDNIHNLAPAFRRRVMAKYEGTTLGRQELHAELLEETPGALWTRSSIDLHRISPEDCPELTRIVVAIDPATTSSDESDACGIVAAGELNGHYYVLDDVSAILSPDAWAKRAIALYHLRHGDRVVAEVNQGGDMVRTIVHTIDPNIPYKGVHASKGKHARAEPVAALYEQMRVHHVGCFGDLEDEQCNYVPSKTKKSPDRMDALVWAITELTTGEDLLVGPGGGSSTSRWAA